jgi:hypothetical protein
VTLELSVTERNFLGRGQYVRAAVGGGLDENRTFDFSFTEPYFLGVDLAAGFDLYRRESGTRMTPSIQRFQMVALCGSSRQSPMIFSSGCPTPLIAQPMSLDARGRRIVGISCCIPVAGYNAPSRMLACECNGCAAHFGNNLTDTACQTIALPRHLHGHCLRHCR